MMKDPSYWKAYDDGRADERAAIARAVQSSLKKIDDDIATLGHQDVWRWRWLDAERRRLIGLLDAFGGERIEGCGDGQ